MKTLAVVQARMGSSRLPGKVMKKIAGVPAIELLLRRLSQASLLDGIVLATSQNPEDDFLSEFVEGLGYSCIRGHEHDVLSRYITAAQEKNAQNLVRITGDCPLVDGRLVDQVVKKFHEGSYDYYSNVGPPTFPDGLDVEVFSTAALIRSSELINTAEQREHVTQSLRDSGRFRVGSLCLSDDYSNLRWTLDEAPDLTVLRKIFNHFSPDIFFDWEQVKELVTSQPEKFDDNSKIQRNEGADMSAGPKLWRRAKNIIPGGNMLLSKRPEMFLPETWPAYFSKAKGCKIWDIEGSSFIDMSLMGVGTNTLGYGHPEVDAAVLEAIKSGNLSTLNAPEEVYLAERLIGMHPWADMVRFARSGGEANAISIRIARAATGKDKVAICGYHGWHDWYLSANLGDEETLAGHLLPGLQPKGVPLELKNTVFPFKYNNFDELTDIVNNHEIGAIKMEVVRNEQPNDNFLQKVRKLASLKGIVLIFDECTSAFRENFGGIHKKYGVEPDLATFGKAIGNGYAITAVIGSQSVMEAAQDTFISSTFWTERIGSAAALKTLEIMEQSCSWETISSLGQYAKEGWDKLAKKHDLDINQMGLSALANFSFVSSDNLKYKTLITQEMLKKGFLAGNAFYASTAHSREIVDKYLADLDPIFQIINDCENGREIDDLLDGPVCQSGFQRLN